MNRILIVGAGQAGAEAAFALRAKGFTGSVIVAGDEKYFPYERPPLSKEVLKSSATPFEAYVRPRSAFTMDNIELRRGESIASLDLEGHTALSTTGKILHFDKCILATGGRARSAKWVPFNSKRCFTLRTKEDALEFRGALNDCRHVAIVGGGFLGLEVASTLMERGLKVTVVESSERILHRALPQFFSEQLRALHESLGVRFLLSESIQAYSESASGISLSLSGKSEQPTLEADVCLLAIGQLPNFELATAAGLDVENGVCVDEYCRTSHSDVYAAGDCTSIRDASGEELIRIESWQNAREQAIAAASNVLGDALSYQPKFWFWTDQCGWNIQILGRPDPATNEWVKRDMGNDSFMYFGICNDALVQIFAVNAGRELRAARHLLGKSDPELRKKLPDTMWSLRKGKAS